MYLPLEHLIIEIPMNFVKEYEEQIDLDVI